MTLILAAAALVLLGAIGALVAVTVSGSDDAAGAGADPDPSVAAGEQVSVFELSVGQCLSVDQEADTLEQVGSITCAEPHTAEVYALIAHPAAPGQPFPGADAITSFADTECIARFRDYVGVDYAVSAIFSTSLTPTELSWQKSGDREVVCLLISGDGSPLAPGSLRGSGI